MPAKRSESRFIQIGYTLKPHGLKGEVSAVFDYAQYPEKIAKLRKLFLGNGDNPLPYLVEKIYPSGKKNFYLTIQGIDTREKAAEISGCKIFLPVELFEKTFLEKDTISPAMLIGFTARDEKKNNIGTIEDIFEMPQQMLAQVFVNGKEALLPLNDSTLVKIDKRKKTVTLNLPEGLLDIF